jgi:hypothetical protein
MVTHEITAAAVVIIAPTPKNITEAIIVGISAITTPYISL